MSEPGRLRSLCEQYARLKRERKELEKLADDKKQEEMQVEQELLPLMKELDAQKITLAGIGTIYLQTKFYVKALPDKMDDLVAWLDDHGLGVLAKRSIHSKTLQAQYNEWSDGDKPIPPQEIVSAYPETKVIVRKETSRSKEN